jgi:hypothetical protein
MREFQVRWDPRQKGFHNELPDSISELTPFKVLQVPEDFTQGMSMNPKVHLDVTHVTSDPVAVIRAVLDATHDIGEYYAKNPSVHRALNVGKPYALAHFTETGTTWVEGGPLCKKNHED